MNTLLNNMDSLKRRKKMELKYSLTKSWLELIWHQSILQVQFTTLEKTNLNIRSLHNGDLEPQQNLEQSSQNTIFTKTKDFQMTLLKQIMLDKNDVLPQKQVQNLECQLKVWRKHLVLSTTQETDLKNRNLQNTRSGTEEIRELKIVSLT